MCTKETANLYSIKDGCYRLQDVILKRLEGNPLKVIFVQPPDPPRIRIFRDHAGMFGTPNPCPVSIIPPLDLAYSAAVLERHGHEAKIIDANALFLSEEAVLKQISVESPQLVVVNTSILSIYSDLDLADHVKVMLPNSIVAVTGSHVAFMPQIAFEGKRKLDLVVKGEFENTIPDILENFDDLGKVKGIIYKDESGKMTQTADRPFITDLDRLPFPAYHLLPMDRYRHDLFKLYKPFTTMLASRGCPVGCIYCPYPIALGKSWRARSAENVLEEIEFLVNKYRINYILFRDQIFTFDIQRAERICNEIIRRDLDIHWRCETLIDKLSKSLMIKMKKAGCQTIQVGVESGDPRILSTIGKRGLTKETVRRIFREARKVGLKTHAFFMFGLPGETKQSIYQTIQFAKELDSDEPQFTIVTPYPGTVLYRIAEQRGWLLTKDWTQYTMQKAVMRTDKLTADDLNYVNQLAPKIFHQHKSTRRIMEEFFRNPSKVLADLGSPSKCIKWISDTISLRIKEERNFKKWCKTS